MSDLEALGPQGALREGWATVVDDYALVCGWALRGKILIVGDAAGGLYAYQGKSGDELWKQSGVHDGGLLAMSIHRNGELFATAGQDGHVYIRKTEDGDTSTALELGEGWVEHLCWSPDGQHLVVAFSRRVFVFDIDGKESWRSDEQASTVSAIAWASETELAIAGYGSVSFFDVSTGEMQQKLEWKGSLVSMVLSPDGDIVACGSQDKSVHFWRRSSGEDSEMSGYQGKPGILAFDHTGTLLATNGFPKVTVWSFQGDGPEGTHPGMLDLHVRPISSLTFAPRGRRLASGARDGSIGVWALENDGEGNAIGVAMMGDPIAALAWRPDGHALAAVNAKGGVCVLRVRD